MDIEKLTTKALFNCLRATKYYRLKLELEAIVLIMLIHENQTQSFINLQTQSKLAYNIVSDNIDSLLSQSLIERTNKKGTKRVYKLTQKGYKFVSMVFYL